VVHEQISRLTVEDLTSLKYLHAFE
jgi:hypothetical protein